MFDNYVHGWESHSICGMVESVIHRRRPYGSVSIIYCIFKGSTEKIWFKVQKKLCHKVYIKNWVSIVYI